MYGQPGRMVGRFTLRDDRTLFLFVFAADGDPLPSTLDQQKAMLRGKYAAGRWECPLDPGRTGSRNRTLFRPRQPDQDEELVERTHRPDRGCRFLRIAAGRTRFGIGDDLGLRAGGRACRVRAGDIGKPSTVMKHACGPSSRSNSAAPNASPAPLRRRPHGGSGFRNQVIRAFAIPGLARLAVGREIIDTCSFPNMISGRFSAIEQRRCATGPMTEVAASASKTPELIRVQEPKSRDERTSQPSDAVRACAGDRGNDRPRRGRVPGADRLCAQRFL